MVCTTFKRDDNGDGFLYVAMWFACNWDVNINVLMRERGGGLCSDLAKKTAPTYSR